MGAIVLDANKVNSYVLPNLTKTNNTMQDAYSTSSTLKNSLPGSFSYRSIVNEISNQIYSIKKEISNVSSMISKKIENAKKIENKSTNRAGAISSLAAKIGTIAGGVKGAVIGAATGGVAGAAVGAVVGSVAGKGIGKAVVNTGAKIVSGFKSACSTIWNGIKSVGQAIWDGCKKVVNKVSSFVQEKVMPVIKNIGNAISEGFKAVGNFLKTAAATISNLATSVVEGVWSFIEAIGDVVLLVVGGVCSIFTFFADLVTGIATGEWEWKATGAVWKKWIMPWIGYDWTTKLFDVAHENRLVGFLVAGNTFLKEQNEASADWAKRGSAVCKVGKSVGYYAAMIVATIFTAGAATAATGATAVGSVSMQTIAQGTVAATASLGKNTQKNYNKTIDSKVTDYYINETMKVNEGMSLEEATAIVEYNIENGLYSDQDSIRKNAMDNITGGEIAGNIGKAAGTAVIDGGIYFVAGAAGDKIKSLNETVKVAGDAANLSNVSKFTTFAMKHPNTVTTGIKASKAYISEGYNSLVDGDEYDFKAATMDAASIVIAETALYGVKNINIKGKGILYKSGVKKDTPVDESFYQKITGESYKVDTGGLNTPDAGEQVKQTFKEAFPKIAQNSLKTGVEKGEEKLIKDATSFVFDEVVEKVEK